MLEEADNATITQNIAAPNQLQSYKLQVLQLSYSEYLYISGKTNAFCNITLLNL